MEKVTLTKMFRTEKLHVEKVVKLFIIVRLIFFVYTIISVKQMCRNFKLRSLLKKGLYKTFHYFFYKNTG